ncbi:MAG TPA: hypothetical protein VM737_05755 [Gemmatimonadota bacterium]|nr:hypothetical protein [Gemmatimonadota bacterium]
MAYQTVLRSYIRRCRHAAADARDRRSIDLQYETLHAESADVLEYQTTLPDPIDPLSEQ